MTKSSKAKRLLAMAQRSLEGAYLRSPARNAILSLRSQRRTDRFINGHKRFVIFLLPGANLIGGGALSLFSIAAETVKLLAKDATSVAVCTAHGEPRILRYTKFDNDMEVLAFDDLLQRFPSGAEILVHVPEMWTRQFVTDCADVYRSRSDVTWRFNILLQNIDRIPSRENVAEIQKLGFTTATAAHRAYATDETARKLGCPLHFLSTWICPEAYVHVGYEKKKKLVMVSPDFHPDKEKIIRKIADALPDHRIIEIRDMTYWKYRQIIRKAKFAFTFGEGLDGYLVEPIFSGGVAMAIFNARFFTDEYKNLDGIFSDSASAAAKVETFLRAADNKASFEAIAARQFDVAAKNYVQAEYLQNIKSYYERYFPRPSPSRVAI